MVAPVVLISAFGMGNQSPTEQSPAYPSGTSPTEQQHSELGLPLERIPSRHSFISRISHPLSRVHSRRSHEFDPEDHHHHEHHENHDEDAIREQEEEAEAEADLDEAEAEDLEQEQPVTKPAGRELIRTNTQVAFEEQSRGPYLAGGRGGAGRFRRTTTMDSGVTSSSMSSWVSNQHVSWLRSSLRRLRHFVFQTGPGQPLLEFVPNYRYIPILSGVLCPFAILLEIPGLTEHWYIRTENNQVIEFRKNPPIIDVAMAVSMFCGVVANVALITRFLEVRVKQMTWVAMIFLAFHDVINTVTVTIFGVIHRFSDGFTYGEAYWMCVCSTVFSVIVLCTLAYDLKTTTDFHRSGSGLTRKQRSLVIMVMILICYIALGSLVFSLIMNLTFQNGLYFTVVSIETIGFGDIFPTNVASTIFCIIYTTFGIINVGLVVNTTRETIIEAFENAYRQRAHDLARKRHESKMLRVQQREKRFEIEQQLRMAGLPVYIKVDLGPRHIGGGRGGGGASFGPSLSKLVLNEKGLEEWKKEQETNEKVEFQRATTQDTGLSEQSKILETREGRFEAADRSGDVTVVHSEQVASEANLTESGVHDGPETEGETYVQFRRRIAREERKEFITKLVVAVSIFVLFWVVGAGIFMATEKEWGFGKAFYFCWMSFSTIGYGEITPQTPAGRAIFVVWALMGVAAMTILIAVLSEAYTNRYKSALQKGSFQKAMKHLEAHKAEHENDDVQEDHHDEDEEHPADVPPAVTPLEITQRMREHVYRTDGVPSVVKAAKAFHEYLKYFGDGGLQERGGRPEGLTRLLEEAAESEKMDERLKNEMLDNDDACKALFYMSNERAFRKLVEVAEKAAEAIRTKETELAHLIEVLVQKQEEDDNRSAARSRRSGSRVPRSKASSARVPQTPRTTASSFLSPASHQERRSLDMSSVGRG